MECVLTVDEYLGFVWSKTIHQLLSILSTNCHQNQMFKRQLSWECKTEITGLQSQAREALWAELWPCHTFSLLPLVSALNLSRAVSGLDILSSSRSELYKIRKKKTMYKLTWHWTCIWEKNVSDSTGQRSELPGLIVCLRNLGAWIISERRKALLLSFGRLINDVSIFAFTI